MAKKLNKKNLKKVKGGMRIIVPEIHKPIPGPIIPDPIPTPVRPLYGSEKEQLEKDKKQHPVEKMRNR